MADRPEVDDVRISIRTTLDTKYRIARAAAHHGLSISKYMKLCTLAHMDEHGLWDLPGRVNQQAQGTEGRPRWSSITETKDPDDKEKGTSFL
jgi:hypothetical protein